MMRWKFDVIKALADRGYNSLVFKDNKLISQNAFTKIRKGDTNVSMDTVNSLCALLRCQPGDLLECVLTDDEKIKYF